MGRITRVLVVVPEASFGWLSGELAALHLAPRVKQTESREISRSAHGIHRSCGGADGVAVTKLGFIVIPIRILERSWRVSSSVTLDGRPVVAAGNVNPSSELVLCG